VAIPLAKAGFQVMGIDVSPEMLAMTRAKLDKNLQKRVRLVQGDMRQFDLGERFNMAFYALRTFAHLTTTAAQIQSLQCVRSHLTDVGLLIIALHNPDLAWLVEMDRELTLAWVKPNPTGEGTIAKFESFTVDPARQLQQVTFFYDETDPVGATRRTIASFPTRYFFRYEVELLLDRCGFEIEAVYGSFDLDSYGPDSEEMIFVARKR
jgi:SAM-dependent methyltransferase